MTENEKGLDVMVMTSFGGVIVEHLKFVDYCFTDYRKQSDTE